MEVVEQYPFAVEEDAHVAIPLPDGCVLSARVWRPVGAGPVPAILEYLPYRKRDGTAARDAGTHPYLAGHGYVCVRVDMRGCGESQGLMHDEYTAQELADGVDVINWLAEQPWCSGEVGIMGISWGGFNGLQIAALDPEPLKAVVTICSTTDRFADDIHYKGGLMLGENPGWAATALSWFSMPPDPALVGEAWRSIWMERLEATPFLLERWVEHQVRDEYWKHGSVCEDWAAITAPVLTVGGAHDGYRNTMGHLVDNLSAPVKGIAGPWNHKYPHMGVPGPRIDFLGEMLRWWDHWLKGVDRGVENDPNYRVYVMDSVRPEVSYEHRPGRWVGLDTPRGSEVRTFAFDGSTLASSAGPVDRAVATDVACGRGTGEYFPFGFGPGELPDDQQADDARSMCFDSDPLDADLSIVGQATVHLTVSSDRPRAQVAVRLCDLRPDGTSALIAHGFLNLRMRNGFDRRDDLPVGDAVEAVVELDQAAYRLPAGHRLRVALSPSYFPFVWPEAEAVTLTVTAGSLALPVVNDEGVAVAFEGPKTAPLIDFERRTEVVEHKTWTDDGATVHLLIEGDDGLIRNPNTGLVTSEKVQEDFAITVGDPSSATAEFLWDRTLGRDSEFTVRTVARVKLSSDGPNFVCETDLEAFDGDESIFRREWRAQVLRR